MDKQELIDCIQNDDELAEQIIKIFNALGTAQVCGKAIVLPKNEESPIVVISFEPELKRIIEKQLADHDKKPPWN
tara:strand:+ start:9827 stop:10051 length:225 start_codon:yes stop_codon:yes gene_type:complete